MLGPGDVIGRRHGDVWRDAEREQHPQVARVARGPTDRAVDVGKLQRDRQRDAAGQPISNAAPVYTTELSMSWVDPWVWSGWVEIFHVFGGLCWAGSSVY